MSSPYTRSFTSGTFNPYLSHDYDYEHFFQSDKLRRPVHSFSGKLQSELYTFIWDFYKFSIVIYH